MLRKPEGISYEKQRFPIDNYRIGEIAVLLSHLTTREIDIHDVAQNVHDVVMNRHNQFMAVAVSSGHLVGMATLTFKPIPSERTAYIDDVVVHPDFQGQGIGKGLMSLIEEQAREKQIDKLQLTSSDKREAALELYSELGFTVKDTNFLVKSLNASS